MSSARRPFITAPRFSPLLGAAVGAVGGGIYWMGGQIWPTSVAVVLAMAATRMAKTAMSTTDDGENTLIIVFAVLIEYNALMALSALRLPYPLPANVALGLIMIAGHMASRALLVSVVTASHLDIAIALMVGFAPAALLGMTGLIGLVAAILARIGYAAYAGRIRAAPRSDAREPSRLQLLTEVCFYLGAAAASTFI